MLEDGSRELEVGSPGVGVVSIGGNVLVCFFKIGRKARSLKSNLYIVGMNVTGEGMGITAQ